MCTSPSTPSPSSTNSERHELGHRALDDGADREVLDELLPRIVRGLLETERDALAVRSTSSTCTLTWSPTLTTSDGWLTWLHESSEMCTRPSMPPRSTKAPKATMLETTRQAHALLQLAEDLGALVLAALLEHHAAREDHVVAVAVHLDDPRLEAITKVGRESFTRRRSTSEAGRNPRRPISRIDRP